MIKKAVNDFFGNSNADKERLISYFLKRNKPKLNEEEKIAVWHINGNLADKTYKTALEG